MPVIDFEITANRPDCLSHVGLAREASRDLGSAAARARTSHDVVARRPDRQNRSQVDIEAADLCPRYCAQVFAVRSARRPHWLRERLEAAGVRPINNVVDVTNYVMLEMGQPMHAFDLEARCRAPHRRAPGARRRNACARSTAIDRTLDPDMLVIADAERARSRSPA